MSAGSLRNPVGPELGGLVERFAEYLAFERRCSPHTVLAYRRDLSGLVAFLGEQLSRPPLLGEHTDEVLKEQLGLDDAALADLRAKKSI